ncbi:CHAT domain-containing protein [Streptomyces sp. 3214.6]|uniref:CHAT domain-containing protein n=1 Tax=Streptomyces sp. 3214.6 TaxID=1882757 RepID=UPI0013520CE9|nr:CHAT domain-containing protein [Streptomyces sp. 3214.6]
MVPLIRSTSLQRPNCAVCAHTARWCSSTPAAAPARSTGSAQAWGASQFLQAGAGAFVGTLWPVRSQSALMFADAFYRQLVLKKQPLGQASLAARRAISDQDGDPTWLAYSVYGSPAATAHTTTPGSIGVRNS